jgi:YggT family protein
MFVALGNLINIVSNIFILIIIAESVLSFFVNPYHPVRVALGRIINPFLGPIRRVVPSLGMLDLSPLILIILIEILNRILVSFLYSL